MPVHKRFVVALLAAAGGASALGAYSLIASPRAEYGDLAVVTVIFTAAHVVAVQAAQRWLSRGMAVMAPSGRRIPDRDTRYSAKSVGVPARLKVHS